MASLIQSLTSPALLIILASFLTNAGICYGFLSSHSCFSSKFPFIHNHASSKSSPEKSIRHHGSYAVVREKKIPDFTVMEDEDEGEDEDSSVRRPYMPPDFSVVDDDDDDILDDEGPYIPPAFSVVDDDDFDIETRGTLESSSDSRESASKGSTDVPPEITVDPATDYEEASIGTKRRPIRIKKKKRDTSSAMAGTSWMEKNAKFTNNDDDEATEKTDSSSPWQSNKGDRFKRSISDTKTFRQDFRKTRVFVQGIPQGVSWQDLKDHFRVAGNVVFASVSVDVNTGESKGHGIVQFETTSMAQNAIDIMADHPLSGSVLYVREDVQENDNPNARLRNSSAPKGPTPPTKWKCANEDNAVFMSEEELSAIRNLIKARDDARRRRKYDVSDRIRDELKNSHGVFIDDRLKMWWTAVDGNKVPQSIHDIKGEGRWKLKPWRQIPTTPENDACVNSDLVEGLLKQRDIARREKDFQTADALLEEARTSPDGDLTLRIHDESRTWRVWTETRPPTDGPYQESQPMPSDPREARKVAARQCVEIVKDCAPEKVDEIVDVLKRFPGREFQILKRLKKQYL